MIFKTSMELNTVGSKNKTKRLIFYEVIHARLRVVRTVDENANSAYICGGNSVSSVHHTSLIGCLRTSWTAIIIHTVYRYCIIYDYNLFRGTPAITAPVDDSSEYNRLHAVVGRTGDRTIASRGHYTVFDNRYTDDVSRIEATGSCQSTKTALSRDAAVNRRRRRSVFRSGHARLKSNSCSKSIQYIIRIHSNVIPTTVHYDTVVASV